MSRILLDRIGGRIASMRVQAAFALAIALAVPASSQRQAGQSGGFSAHAGGSGGHPTGAMRGGAPAYVGGHSGGYGGGHSGYSGRPGFSGGTGAPSYSGLTGLQAPSAFSQPGRFPMPGMPQPGPSAGVALPYGSGSYQGFGDRSDGRSPHRGPYHGGHDRDHDRDHDRHNHRWGSYGYAPGYVYAYPYVADPGFYDWGATDYSENQQDPYAAAQPEQGAGSGYGAEEPPPEIPQQPAQPATHDPSAAPQLQEYHFASASPAAATPISAKPLTVIFKGGRAPEKMQNYMVTSSALTNLDGEHFEKIPLDEIDVLATQQANRRSGIDFEVPVALRN